MAINPISQETLEAIGGQKTARAAQQFQQSMSNLYAVTSDIKDRQMKREAHQKQMRLADLNIESKVQKGLGSSAIGVLDLLNQTENFENFMENYQSFRANSPQGIQEGMPNTFNTKEEARMWASQQAAMADKLIPYLELQKKGESMKQWQFTTNILAKDPATRTRAEEEYLDFFGSKGVNIHVGDPSKAKLTDTVMNLDNYNIPGTDQRILESLDIRSRKAFVSSVSNLAEAIVAKSEKTDNPIDRSTAVGMAVTSLSANIQPTASWKDKLPTAIGQYLDQDYTYVTPDMQKQATQQQSVQEQGVPKVVQALRPGETAIFGGYEWRRKPDGGFQKRKVK